MKILIDSNEFGRVENIEYKDKILISRIQLNIGVYHLINPNKLYVNKDITFKDLKEIRRFIKSNRKQHYSLFNDVEILPYKNIGLKISCKNESFIIKY